MWRIYIIYFARDSICIFFLKCPKIEHINFRCFSSFKIDHVFFSRNSPLFMFVFPEISHFSCSQNQMGKWGISKSSNIKKWGISRKKHVINFKTGRFWGISGKKCICYHVQNLLHIRFGAFQETSRT